ncbi:SDR family oxidoreductase [Arthrobacter zhaoguopingii]|uniref:SDR family oxidoreductase n=1 Tax=Arthrobacter zhaoguopingii TaxID=2681491 RepID=UPI001359EFA6|nr:SDR family oxidoreductase [Arthrobacter zhaoguopingii]
MQIKGSTVLITGANRGIGAEFVRQLKARGAGRIYATARNADSMPFRGGSGGVEVLELDITEDDQIAAVAALAVDVDLLINNAGVASGADLLTGDLEVIRREFEINFFGALKMTRAFAPVLGANGGGAVLNVLSAAAWFSAPGATSYAASKAAAWSLTDATRVQLAAQGTKVLGLHMALVDTDMTAGVDAPKTHPADVVAAALDGIEQSRTEVLADPITVGLKSGLHLDPAARYGTLPTP